MKRNLIAGMAAMAALLSAQPAAAQRYAAPGKTVGSKLDSHLQDLVADQQAGRRSVSPSS